MREGSVILTGGTGRFPFSCLAGNAERNFQCPQISILLRRTRVYDMIILNAEINEDAAAPVQA